MEQRLHLRELRLQVDVELEELGLGCLAERHPKDGASGRQPPLPQLKLRGEDPELGKGELGMRHELECRSIHLSRARNVAHDHLLVYRVPARHTVEGGGQPKLVKQQAVLLNTHTLQWAIVQAALPTPAAAVRGRSGCCSAAAHGCRGRGRT
jgi:hypothetical protein